MRTKLMLGALPIVLILASCSGSGGTKENLVVIRTDRDFQERQRELETLTLETLTKFAEQKPLTQQDFDNLDKAEPIAQGIIAYQPRAFTPHLVLGQIRLAQGKTDQALQNMQQCLSLVPPPENWSPEVRFIVSETLNDIGNIYYGKNNFKEAESHLRQALDIDPQNIKYLTNLAQILIAAKQYESAKVILERIRKVNPKSEALAALEKQVTKPTDDAGTKK